MTPRRTNTRMEAGEDSLLFEEVATLVPAKVGIVAYIKVGIVAICKICVGEVLHELGIIVQ